MSRLPIPGGDTGNWGTILNDYLAQSHSNDGSLKDNSIAESKLDTAARAKLNATAGPVGATGAQGPAGSVGATGATGPAGSIGPQGATGASGTTGSSGATGATGPQGDPATNLVTSVAGKQGVVALVKADVGLANVDNTSDANKPVSTAAQTALNAKADTTTVDSIDSRVTVLESSSSTPLLVLGPSDPVPGGTAAGTVILRTL